MSDFRPSRLSARELQGASSLTSSPVIADVPTPTLDAALRADPLSPPVLSSPPPLAFRSSDTPAPTEPSLQTAPFSAPPTTPPPRLTKIVRHPSAPPKDGEEWWRRSFYPQRLQNSPSDHSSALVTLFLVVAVFFAWPLFLGDLLNGGINHTVSAALRINNNFASLRFLQTFQSDSVQQGQALVFSICGRILMTAWILFLLSGMIYVAVYVADRLQTP
jgi:hypothetical protein